jgi:hypothetical protein
MRVYLHASNRLRIQDNSVCVEEDISCPSPGYRWDIMSAVNWINFTTWLGERKLIWLDECTGMLVSRNNQVLLNKCQNGHNGDGMVMDYRLNGPGSISGKGKYSPFHTLHNGFGTPQSLVSWGFFPGWSDGGWKLTTHLLLVSRTFHRSSFRTLTEKLPFPLPDLIEINICMNLIL